MATLKPRITVTLEPNHYLVLKSISDDTGQPMSSLISEVIGVSMPTFERLAVIAQKVSKLKSDQHIELTRSQMDAQAVFDPLLSEIMGQFDLFIGQVENDLDKAALSPLTNRGVTPSIKELSQPNKTKALKAQIPANTFLKKSGKKS